MRTARMLVSHGCFIRSQRVVILGSDDRGLIVKGKAIGGPNSVQDWDKDVVICGVQENEVVDYVPEPAPLTLREKIKRIWPA